MCHSHIKVMLRPSWVIFSCGFHIHSIKKYDNDVTSIPDLHVDRCYMQEQKKSLKMKNLGIKKTMFSKFTHFMVKVSSMTFSPGTTHGSRLEAHGE